MKKLFLALTLLGLAAIADAQDSAVTWPVIAFGWAPVTTFDDGSPLPNDAVVTYNLYASVAATGPFTKVSTTGLAYLAQGVPAGTYWYYLTATYNGVETRASEIDFIVVTGN